MARRAWSCELRDSGFYYLKARYYDPAVGRFLTKDPLPPNFVDPRTINPYPYVLNNPLNRVDPSGMLSEDGSSFPFTLDCLAFVITLVAAALTAAFGPWGILAAAPLFVVALAIDASQEDYPGLGIDTAVETTAPLQFAEYAQYLKTIAFWATALSVGYSAFNCLSEAPEFQD